MPERSTSLDAAPGFRCAHPGYGSVRLRTVLMRARSCARLAARAGRRVVLSVPVAEAAHAGERGHALLVADEATIGAATVVAHGVLGAPRIILRLCGHRRADGCRAEHRHGKTGGEQHRFHGRLACWLITVPVNTGMAGLFAGCRTAASRTRDGQWMKLLTAGFLFGNRPAGDNSAHYSREGLS